MKTKFLLKILWPLAFALLGYNVSFCQSNTQQSDSEGEPAHAIDIDSDIRVKDYFNFMDSIVKAYDSLTSYKITEHLLVNANPWIIDTLKNTDYYLMKARDSFVIDQKNSIVLPEGSRFIIPDSSSTSRILEKFERTSLDLNIPEFKLRILEDSTIIHEFLVRVGRNETKFLEMSGREEDLRTRTGSGHIVGFVKDPEYRNPVDNKQYHVTNRDDGKITKLPRIPFIETEINGLRYGQLIHPTTNPETLGKAYSNGCIGTRESDAWVIYYAAPIGTPIKIRYDLIVKDDTDRQIVLKDIYQYN